jgi:hypothetical protein
MMTYVDSLDTWDFAVSVDSHLMHGTWWRMYNLSPDIQDVAASAESVT